MPAIKKQYFFEEDFVYFFSVGQTEFFLHYHWKNEHLLGVGGIDLSLSIEV